MNKLTESLLPLDNQLIRFCFRGFAEAGTRRCPDRLSATANGGIESCFGVDRVHSAGGDLRPRSLQPTAGVAKEDDPGSSSKSFESFANRQAVYLGKKVGHSLSCLISNLVYLNFRFECMG